MDQTKYFGQALEAQNKYSSTNQFPTDVVGASIEYAKLVTKGVNLGQFLAEQEGLHLLNTYDGKVINPAVLSGVIPGEGILPATLDTIGTNYLLKTKATDSENAEFNDSSATITTAALLGNNLGQEAGGNFIVVTDSSIGGTITKTVNTVVNSIVGALGIGGNDTPSAKIQTLGDRLRMNSLDPRMTYPEDTYNQIYSQDKISGVSVSDLSQAFLPIDSSSTKESVSLSEDNIFIYGLERAFDTNAAQDQGNKESTVDKTGSRVMQIYSDPTASASPPIVGSDASSTEPIVDQNGMIFPFYFQSLNSFARHPEKFITFQATMRGIKEDYAPSWSTRNFFGRNTPSYIYQYTDRTISISFTIFASNRDRMGLLKQRINWLARHTYPSYVNLDKSSTKVIFEAPIIAITIGDMFKNLPGIIKNLNYDWDMQDNNRWELTKDMIMLQAVDVTISYVVLPDKLMQNAGMSLVDNTTLDSSDFYEYIKPQNRGIKTDEFSKGNSFAQYSANNLDAALGSKVK